MLLLDNQGIFHRRAVRARKEKKRPHPLTVERLEDRYVLSGDMILRWNELALQAVALDHSVAAPSNPGPTKTARALAIVHAAMYDAVNVIDQSYTPYLVDLRLPRFISKEAAAAQAAHDTLTALYPQQQAVFDAALRQSFGGIPLIPRWVGVLVGNYVAQQILSWRSNDGSQLPDPPHQPGTQPGAHRPDPLHPGQGYYGVGWDRVLPFAIRDSAQFDVLAPPALNSLAYTRSFNEVKAYGAENSLVRTPEQTIIGIYWGYDGSPGLGTPPRLYNQITRTIAVQQRNSLVENARLFALVNLAMADAGLAAWHTKYTDDFWRPVVGVREAATDGNPQTTADPNWRPLGAPCSNGCPAVTNFTPNFPAYTSGHATFGAAMFRTLRNFYGRDRIPFSFVSDEYNGVTRDPFGNVRPRVTRSYASFSQAAEENGQSRIYLGIHWSFDKVQGIAQGNALADYVFSHYLRPRGSQPGVPDSETGSEVVDVISPRNFHSFTPSEERSATTQSVRLPADDPAAHLAIAAALTAEDAWTVLTGQPAVAQGVDRSGEAPELLVAFADGPVWNAVENETLAGG